MNRVAVLLRSSLNYPLQFQRKIEEQFNTKIVGIDSDDNDRRSGVRGGERTSPNDSRLIRWFWGSFALLIATWTFYLLWDPIPSDSEVINDVLLTPDDLRIDAPDIPALAEDRTPPVSDNIASDTGPDSPVSLEASAEIRDSSGEFVSDLAQPPTPSTHIQTPANESDHVAEKGPSALLEPELSLERLRLSDGPRIISGLRVLGRCTRSRNSCVRIATKVRRRAWLLAFYSIEDRIGVPDCDTRLRAQPRGEHTWRVTLTKDRAASLITFHVLATTKREVAEQLSEHFRASPGACMASGDLSAWVDELYRHVAMTPSRVAYRHILLERTAKGFKSPRPQHLLPRSLQD